VDPEVYLKNSEDVYESSDRSRIIETVRVAEWLHELFRAIYMSSDISIFLSVFAIARSSVFSFDRFLVAKRPEFDESTCYQFATNGSSSSNFYRQLTTCRAMAPTFPGFERKA
jgi:hypothetical protein